MSLTGTTTSARKALRLNVTMLVTAMVPPEMPKKEVVGWCVERADGGRGWAWSCRTFTVTGGSMTCERWF